MKLFAVALLLLCASCGKSEDEPLFPKPTGLFNEPSNGGGSSKVKMTCFACKGSGKKRSPGSGILISECAACKGSGGIGR